jgi:hypothetical protein
VILTYLPVKPENELIKRQEILISPNPAGDMITNIIIDTQVDTRDSLVIKKMLWQPDRRFQVTTIKQLPGKPETITTVKVIWNDPDIQ